MHIARGRFAHHLWLAAACIVVLVLAPTMTMAAPRLAFTFNTLDGALTKRDFLSANATAHSAATAPEAASALGNLRYAYVFCNEDVDFTRSTYLANGDGSNVRNIGSGVSAYFINDLVWSPKGRYVIMERYIGSGMNDAPVIDTVSGEELTLSRMYGFEEVLSCSWLTPTVLLFSGATQVSESGANPQKLYTCDVISGVVRLIDASLAGGGSSAPLAGRAVYTRNVNRHYESGPYGRGYYVDEQLCEYVWATGSRRVIKSVRHREDDMDRYGSPILSPNGEFVAYGSVAGNLSSVVVARVSDGVGVWSRCHSAIYRYLS